MLDTIIGTLVYGLLFYFCFLGRIFDAGRFNRGNNYK